MPLICVVCNEVLERVARGGLHTCKSRVKWQCSKCGQIRSTLYGDHQRCPSIHKHASPLQPELAAEGNVRMARQERPPLAESLGRRVAPVARDDVPDSLWLDTFISKLGFEYFNRLQIVDVNNLQCARPMNLVSARWDEPELTMNKEMALCLSKKSKIKMLEQKWITAPPPPPPHVDALIERRNERISCDAIEDEDGRYAALKSSFLRSKRRPHYGLMLPNVDAQSFPFEPSTWQTVQHCSHQVAAFVSGLMDQTTTASTSTSASVASVESLEALEQDRRILSYDDLMDRKQLPFIGGFGSRGLQVYYKSNLAYTPLHDEIGHSQAVNLMLKSSVGVAFWFGVHLTDMSEQYTRRQILNFMMFEKEKNENCVFDMIRDWIDSGVRVWLCVQTPGTAVVSGTFNAPAHMVLTLGERVTQIAWNQGFSVRGMISCLEFWRNQTETDLNSGAATRKILPCLRLQQKNIPIGLEHELQVIRRQLEKDKTVHRGLEFIECRGEDDRICSKCQDPVDLFAVKNPSLEVICYECFRDSEV
eukprot:GILJ01014482.1.p1 GENE.GILJ01014482.1~~GILJ01014482.1.p1  ORF type:complete len:533 (+),score=35.79 GILJ01014482.1:204-1802(+)